MSVRSHPLSRSTLPVLTAATVLLLAPSAAVASPPAIDQSACAQLLARAAVWPGGYEDESGTHRLVSDAYVSYLSAQPACSPPEG